ncbi:MAG: diaminopimelate epimerase [Lachnoclostridium sp.]|nr:diaminopimelate epimerase [Lachnoclostridium sp.]
MHFTKMHGIGNDYIYINCMESCPSDLPSLAIEMSDRHKGVGGDGIILILPSTVADFRMRIFNADGSEAKMCGNGSRCVAKFIHDNDLSEKDTIHLETLAGIKVLSLIKEGNPTSVYAVDMGAPVLRAADVPVIYPEADMMVNAPVETSMGTLKITAVSMGNPHGVVVTDCNIDTLPLEIIGPELENHPIWPDRANIEFINVVNRGELKMRVWERGSGETMACGTGACAAAVATSLLGLTGEDVTVHLRGGDLTISCPRGDHVMMTGQATTVFSGSWIRHQNINNSNT